MFLQTNDSEYRPGSEKENDLCVKGQDVNYSNQSLQSSFSKLKKTFSQADKVERPRRKTKLNLDLSHEAKQIRRKKSSNQFIYRGKHNISLVRKILFHRIIACNSVF